MMVQVNTCHNHEEAKQNEGRGRVEVIRGQEGCLLLKERGSWKQPCNQTINFYNSYRWSFDNEHSVLSLEHLRYGQSNPTFLFHLVPSGDMELTSRDLYACENDTYFGQLYYKANFLCFHWRTIGIHKNEDIKYYYS